jgi:uroporphyrinogen decarboxylase
MRLTDRPGVTHAQKGYIPWRNLPKMAFNNDYSMMLDVLANRRPARLPIYEHAISPLIMEQVLGNRFASLADGDRSDLKAFYTQFCRFFKEMTYDTVSMEFGIAGILPEHGAINGGRPGPIQCRADFLHYPWNELPDLFWRQAEPHFNALREAMPTGMKALGGVGYGVFEISEDLVGYQYLAYMGKDDPDLITQLYQKIGDLMVAIWSRFLEHFSDVFAVCRMGDDLGFKTSTLISPKQIRQNILPQYQRIIGLIKRSGKPFLWHSCGKIFPVMDDVIALGINAKHSNEDIIAPFDEWIARYSKRIGLLGGIDVDLLCQKSTGEIFDEVIEKGKRYRAAANGYALGSGNSIPEYVPVTGYLAMIEAAKKIRELELHQA